MVKIAIAGGNGPVGREIVDALVAAKKHDITILCRNAMASANSIPGVNFRVVKYEDQAEVVEVLQGVHTVLSFINAIQDPDNIAQRTLIDSAIIAGVKRFAPSEWGSATADGIPWYAPKAQVKEYLEKVSENGKLLEYSLFRPGLFLDILASPYQTAKYVEPLDFIWDFEKRRGMAVEGHEDAIVTLTTAADTAAIVALAVDYEGKWPKNGGIRGNRVSFAEIIALGEKIRGSFKVDKVLLEDLEAGELKTSWTLDKLHSSLPADQAAYYAKLICIGALVSPIKGSWDVSDDYNKLFPDYKFTGTEEFLRKVWGGKP